METRHIKIGYEEALNSKKQLLTTQLNLIQTIKKIKTYNFLRKKEIAAKNELKTSLLSLKSKISLIQSTFPEENLQKLKIKNQTKKIEKKNPKNLQSELEEIKKKLEKLE